MTTLHATNGQLTIRSANLSEPITVPFRQHWQDGPRWAGPAYPPTDAAVEWVNAQLAARVAREARAYFLAHYRGRHVGEDRQNYKRGRNRAFRRWLENPQTLS
jgi:hypothetical protein